MGVKEMSICGDSMTSNLVIVPSYGQGQNCESHFCTRRTVTTIGIGRSIFRMLRIHFMHEGQPFDLITV